MGKCRTCKNAIKYTGAYTGTKFIECRLEQEFAEKATLEELREAIEHPEIVPCEYCKGRPKDGGVTFDD